MCSLFIMTCAKSLRLTSHTSPAGLALLALISGSLGESGPDPSRRYTSLNAYKLHVLSSSRGGWRITHPPTSSFVLTQVSLRPPLVPYLRNMPYHAKDFHSSVNKKHKNKGEIEPSPHLIRCRLPEPFNSRSDGPLITRSRPQCVPTAVRWEIRPLWGFR